MRYMHRHHRHNPLGLDVFGENLVTVGWGVVGATGAAAVDDKVVAPLLDAVFPQLGGNHTVRKAIDGFTTLFSAFAVGEGVSFFSRAAGRAAHFGGAIMGGSRLITAFVPNWSLSSSVPISLPDITQFLPGKDGKLIDANKDGRIDSVQSASGQVTALPAGNPATGTVVLDAARGAMTGVPSASSQYPYGPSVPPSLPAGSSLYANIVPSNAFACNRVTGL